jgi:type II secretory pathway pseudopilin PulG
MLATKGGEPGLRDSEEFKRMSAGLPTDVNELGYMSEQVIATYSKVIAQVMSQIAHQGPQEKLMSEMMTQLQTMSGGANYTIRINQPDGIQIISRSDLGAARYTGAAILVAPPAILVAIAVPNFIEAQSRSKVAGVKADQRALSIALEAYRIDWNTYPHGDPSLPDGGWIVWSAGPDGDYDLNPSNIKRAYSSTESVPSSLLIRHTYDPINGTTSGGDIWKIRAGEAVPSSQLINQTYDPTNGTDSIGESLRIRD